MTTLQFTADISKENFNDLENHIKERKDKYLITKYIIGQESNPKDHYHFIIHYETEQSEAYKYQDKLVKTIVDKYKLRGKGKGGKVKYCNGIKQRNIKDIDNCISYITKENNYRYFGYEKEYIEFRQSQSFIKAKENKLDYILKLKEDALEYFNQHFEDKHITVYKLSNGSFTPLRPPSPDHNGIVYFGPRDHASTIKKFIYYYIRNHTETNLKSITTIKSVSFYVVNHSEKIDEDLRFSILESL